MFVLVIALVLILSVLLIVMVLLQPSKSGGVGGAFGNLGASLGSTFGSRRTLDFLAKGTTWVAAALGVVCIAANLFISTSDTAQGNNPVTTGKNATPQATPAPVIPNNAQGAAPAPAPAGAQNAPAGGQEAPVTTSSPTVTTTPVTPQSSNNAPAPKK